MADRNHSYSYGEGDDGVVDTPEAPEADPSGADHLVKYPGEEHLQGVIKHIPFEDNDAKQITVRDSIRIVFSSSPRHRLMNIDQPPLTMELRDENGDQLLTMHRNSLTDSYRTMLGQGRGNYIVFRHQLSTGRVENQEPPNATFGLADLGIGLRERQHVGAEPGAQAGAQEQDDRPVHESAQHSVKFPGQVLDRRLYDVPLRNARGEKLTVKKAIEHMFREAGVSDVDPNKPPLEIALKRGSDDVSVMRLNRNADVEDYVEALLRRDTYIVFVEV